MARPYIEIALCNTVLMPCNGKETITPKRELAVPAAIVLQVAILLSVLPAPASGMFLIEFSGLTTGTRDWPGNCNHTPAKMVADSISRPHAERKVLLAIREGHLDPRLLVSARSLCQRLDADLDILLVATGDSLPPEVASLVGRLRDEGVAYTLTRKAQLRRRDVVRYANTHECIATVVIDSLEGWESVAEDRAADPWARLACPLVTAASPKSEN